MSEWGEYQLSELADVIMGQSPPSSAYNEENIGLPFLQGCAEFGDDYPTARIYCTDPKKLAPANSILISVRAPVGLTNKSDKEYVIGRGLAAIVPTKGDFEFLYYQLNQSKHKLDRVSQGSTFLAINSNDLIYLLIDAPILKTTQRKIARILSTADAAIEKTQTAIAKYKAIKQGMLHDLFTSGIDPATNKLRPIYEDAPHLYKESKLGWIPREWEVEELKNLCDFITDGSHFSPTPIEDGAIIVNVKDIGEFGIDYESCTRISFEEFTFLKKQNCSPKSGDILLSKDGTIGRVVLFNSEREIVILSSIAILRPSLLIKSEYLYCFLKSEYFSKQILVKTSGSALKRIVLKDINTFLLAYPQKSTEQKKISNIIIKIEAKLQTDQTYLHKLQQIKSGLMADLLSGKKEVHVDEEPAN